ncbi:MAG: hypothetical protein U0984_08810 [Prosthecobacter sp.]|nr:hypothetical protein [Prosthecobacter sp.]
MKRQKSSESALLFDWSARDRSAGRLVIAGLVTFGAFVGLFVGFRIITPENRAVTTRPQQVLVLNPEVPAERALINQAMDRSFALIPTDSLGATPPAAARMPGYRPGIASYELKPKPSSPSTAATTRSQFFALDIELEPPASPTVPGAAPAPPPTVLRGIMEGPIARRLNRGITLPGIPLVDSNKPRFQIAIGSRGQVLMALPLSASEDAKVMDQLHAALMDLRFAPAKSEVEWGQVTFRWEEETPS